MVLLTSVSLGVEHTVSLSRLQQEHDGLARSLLFYITMSSLDLTNHPDAEALIAGFNWTLSDSLNLCILHVSYNISCLEENDELNCSISTSMSLPKSRNL